MSWLDDLREDVEEAERRAARVWFTDADAPWNQRPKPVRRPQKPVQPHPRVVTVDAEKWAALVDTANRAFGRDFRYAEAIAQEFHRMQNRRQ